VLRGKMIDKKEKEREICKDDIRILNGFKTVRPSMKN